MVQFQCGEPIAQWLEGHFLATAMEDTTRLAASQGPMPAATSANAPSPPPSDSESSDLELNEEEGWEDAEPQEEQDQIISFLDDKVFPNVPSMLLYCKEKYEFDFLGMRDKFFLDFYGTIKLVNYIRAIVKNGRTTLSDITKTDFEDDKFLIPVLEDDALLFNLDDLQPTSNQGAEPGTNDPKLIARVEELEEELRKTQFQFEDYRNVVKKTLAERWNDSSADQSTTLQEPPTEKRDDDSHYFTSYSYNGKFYTYASTQPYS
jgi:protein arginine N-methyltransferase 3